MRRGDLEHVIRAAADAAQDDEVVVIGSQAILGQFPDAPDPLLLSPEADVYPRNHPERATQATGWCMEAHDLVLAKCAAGRGRDWQFAEEAIRHGVVYPASCCGAHTISRSARLIATGS